MVSSAPRTVEAAHSLSLLGVPLIVASAVLAAGSRSRSSPRPHAVTVGFGRSAAELLTALSTTRTGHGLRGQDLTVAMGARSSCRSAPFPCLLTHGRTSWLSQNRRARSVKHFLGHGQLLVCVALIGHAKYCRNGGM